MVTSNLVSGTDAGMHRDHVDATMIEVMDYFGYKRADGKRDVTGFRKDWAMLTEEEKAQLRAGIGNGTFTYA